MELLSVDFCRDRLPEVYEFQCGTTPWAIAAAEWIKSAPPFPCALQSMEQYGTRVWLHFLADVSSGRRELVGFSSLGPTRMSIPYPDGLRKHIQYVPMMAVASAFQGKRMPDGPKYSSAILQFIIDKARDRHPEDPGLQVHVDNASAIELYKKGWVCDQRCSRCAGNAPHAQTAVAARLRSRTTPQSCIYAGQWTKRRAGYRLPHLEYRLAQG